MGLARLAEHYGGGASRLAVHGDAHLLALASVRSGPIEVVNWHEHEPGSMLPYVICPGAQALLAQSERFFGIVFRNLERQVVDDDAVLRESLDGRHAKIPLLHGGVEGGHRREIPRLQKVHEGQIEYARLGVDPIEHLEEHERLLLELLAGVRRDYAQVGERYRGICENHLVVDGILDAVSREEVGVLPHELAGVCARLLLGYAAGNCLVGDVFRACPDG